MAQKRGKLVLLLLVLSLGLNTGLLSMAEKPSLAIAPVKLEQAEVQVMNDKLSKIVYQKIQQDKYFKVMHHENINAALDKLDTKTKEELLMPKRPEMQKLGEYLNVDLILFLNHTQTKGHLKVKLYVIDVIKKSIEKETTIMARDEGEMKQKLENSIAKVNQVFYLKAEVIKRMQDRVIISMTDEDPITEDTQAIVFRQEQGVQVPIGRIKCEKIMHNESVFSIMNEEKGYKIEHYDTVKIDQEKKQIELLGTLSIDMNTSWVTVLIDGVEYDHLLSRESVENIALSEGEHDLIFYKQGYVGKNNEESIQVKVNIEASKTTWVAPVLKKKETIQKIQTDQHATLKFKTEPEGATIFLNGNELGEDEYYENIDFGSYDITFKKEGYHDQHLRYTIDSKGVHNLGVINLKPNFGTLHIESIPSQAFIWVNGELKGKTPLEIKQKSGPADIRLQVFNYEDKKFQVQIEDGQLHSKKLSLTPMFGELRLTINPDHATVFIDDKKILKTTNPIIVSPIQRGKHKIKVFKKYHEPEVKYLVIKEGELVTMNIDLKAHFGTVSITSKPLGSEIYINNKKIGYTPMQSMKLDRDSYSILIKDSHGWYEPIEKTVDISVGVHQQIKEDLIQKKADLTLYATQGGQKVSGAEIYINHQKQTQKTPATFSDLPAGEIHVRVVKDHQSIEKNIIIEPNKNNEFKAILHPESESMIISTIPSGARVYLDYQLQKGRTPIKIYDLNQGIHKLNIIKQNNQDIYHLEKTIHWEPKGKKRRHFELIKDNHFKSKFIQRKPVAYREHQGGFVGYQSQFISSFDQQLKVESHLVKDKAWDQGVRHEFQGGYQWGDQIMRRKLSLNAWIKKQNVQIKEGDNKHDYVLQSTGVLINGKCEWHLDTKSKRGIYAGLGASMGYMNTECDIKVGHIKTKKNSGIGYAWQGYVGVDINPNWLIETGMKTLIGPNNHKIEKGSSESINVSLDQIHLSGIYVNIIYQFKVTK